MSNKISLQESQAFDIWWNVVQTKVHNNAKEKGWWDEERNDGEMIALMHSELSEALEALRKGDPFDDKVPTSLSLSVELADVVIRIMDFAEARGLNLPAAIVDKHNFNTTRPHKHGKIF